MRCRCACTGELAVGQWVAGGAPCLHLRHVIASCLHACLPHGPISCSPVHLTLALHPLQRLGVKKALVVHSMGLDELTPMGHADVVEVTQQGGCIMMHHQRPGRPLCLGGCREVASLLPYTSIMVSQALGETGCLGTRHIDTPAGCTPPQPLTLASLPPYTGPPPCPNSPPCPDAPAGKRSYQLEPRDLGIPRCTVQDLAGGDAALNAQILMVRVGGQVGRWPGMCMLCETSVQHVDAMAECCLLQATHSALSCHLDCRWLASTYP